MEVKELGREEVFGQPFRFVEAFIGVIHSTNEVDTIEEFTEGQFVKYINNNGSIVNALQCLSCKKAECLVHFCTTNPRKSSWLLIFRGQNVTLQI